MERRKVIRKYSRFFIIYLLLAALSCRTVENTAGPNDLTTMLREMNAGTAGKALQAALMVEAPLSRFHLLSEIAGVLAGMNLTDQAARVTELAELAMSEVPSESARAELLPRLAEGYVRSGRNEKGAALLKEALSVLDGSMAESVQGNILKQVIAIGFQGGESTFDLPGEAVQQSLVIQNLEIRLDLLIYAAEQYRNYNIGLFSDTLIQQAIPAAGSIENLWSRALGMIRLAVLIAETGDEDYGRQMAHRGIRSMENVTVIVRPEEEARKVVRIAGYLAELGMEDDAVIAAETIEFPRLRAEAYAKIAEEWNKQDEPIRSEIYLSIAYEIAREIDDPFRKISALALLGRTAAALSGSGDILDSVFSLLPELINAPSDPFEQQRSLFIYIDALIDRGMTDQAMPLIKDLSSFYDRTRLYLGAAEKLIDLEKFDDAKRTVLTAEQEANKSEFIQDQLYADAAVIMFRLGLSGEAASLLDRIQDPYTLGFAYVQMQKSNPDQIL